jgi:hypothetical protein
MGEDHLKVDMIDSQDELDGNSICNLSDLVKNNESLEDAYRDFKKYLQTSEQKENKKIA